MFFILILIVTPAVFFALLLFRSILVLLSSFSAKASVNGRSWSITVCRCGSFEGGQPRNAVCVCYEVCVVCLLLCVCVCVLACDREIFSVKENKESSRVCSWPSAMNSFQPKPLIWGEVQMFSVDLLRQRPENLQHLQEQHPQDAQRRSSCCSLPILCILIRWW